MEEGAAGEGERGRREGEREREGRAERVTPAGPQRRANGAQRSIGSLAAPLLVSPSSSAMSRRGRPDDHYEQQHLQHSHSRLRVSPLAAGSAAAAAVAAAASSGHAARSAPSPMHIPHPRSHIIPSRRRNIAAPVVRPQMAFAAASAAYAVAAAASSHSHAASSLAAESAPSSGVDRRPAKRVKKEEPAAAASSSAAAAAAAAASASASTSAASTLHSHADDVCHTGALARLYVCPLLFCFSLVVCSLL